MHQENLLLGALDLDIVKSALHLAPRTYSVRHGARNHLPSCLLEKFQNIILYFHQLLV